MYKRILLLVIVLFLSGCAEQRGIPIAAPETFRHAAEDNVPGVWVQVSTLPTARSEMPVAVTEDRFYIPGGFLGLRSLEAYDPATNEWTSLADMPQGRHHAMSAGYGGKVYVFGGAQNTSWLPTNTTWIYDPAANVWTERTPMPETRMSGAAVTLGDGIYVIGGVGGTEALLRYDPAADTWTSLAPLPRHREHLAAVVFNGELWALGGRQSDSATLAGIDIYDPVTNTWRDGPAMLEARSGFGAAVANGKIVAVGGEVLDRQPWQVLATAEVYDPESGWSALPDLPTGLHGHPLAAAGDRIYALGGSIRAGAIENEGKVLVLVIGD